MEKPAKRLLLMYQLWFGVYTNIKSAIKKILQHIFFVRIAATLLILGNLFLLPHRVSAQTIEQAMELLGKVQKKNTSMLLSETKKEMFAHLTVSTILAKNSPYTSAAYSSENIDVKITWGSQRIAYESSYFSYYRDQKECFTIVHPNHIIFRNSFVTQSYSSVSKQGKSINTSSSDAIEQMDILGKRILEQFKVTACKKIEWNRKNVWQITLIPVEKIKSQSVKKTTFYVDPHSQKLLYKEIEFKDGYPYVKQQITYHVIDFKHRSPLPVSAKDCIFLGNKLRPQYKSYRLEST